MNKPRFSSLIRADREYAAAMQTMREDLAENRSLPIVINGLSGGAQTAFLCEAVRDAREASGAPVLLLVGGDEEGEKLSAVLNAAGLAARTYRKRDLIFTDMSASHDTERERLSVLSAVTASSLDAVVATPSAALSYTIPEPLLLDLSCGFRAGDTLSPEDLVSRLLLLNFSHTDTVDGAGQFAHRGGIVDFFPDAGDEPVRVEFFGDEIDRITRFDPISQRATSPCDEVKLLPAGEVLLSVEAKARILQNIEKLIKKASEPTVLQTLAHEKQILTANLAADFADKYLGLVYESRENLLSYFTTFPRAVVFLVGTAAVKEEMKASLASLAEERTLLLSRGLVTAEAAQYSADAQDFDRFLDENLPIHVNPFSGGVGDLRLAGLFGFRTRRTVAYGDNPYMLLEDIDTLIKTGYRVLLLSENKAGSDSLAATLADRGVPHAALPEGDPDASALHPGVVYLSQGECEGFDLIMPRIALLSMTKDEGRAVMAHRRRQRNLKRSGNAGERLMSYADLSVGDYVVHESYGIGRFEGISTVRIDGVTKDYITVRYAGTDKLFIPCDRLEVISKYVGAHAEDGSVKLSQMGGGDWQKARTKAKAAARDLAQKLIALYAERARKPGFAFPAESAMEREFAEAFDFEPTDAQLDAIEDIRKDMQRPIPMNRLLCGDVGFGKTEVAIRAAFKAILAGKQVAFLVPTTILALQHYQTAISRMRGYPVNIAMLSRFSSSKERSAVLRRVARGEIDLLIGTHALLSKELKFHDLGLLIIDEEQRFGVSQKEKLKEIAKNVDVLTMTATPIPRTLNMALTGISDISVLDEAPGDRRPVQTYVLEHDDEMIFSAIRRELARGGQVLYMRNRIEDIEYRADKITAAIPEARVAVAHGRKEKEEIEDIWQGLVRGEIDVLVCTSIVETGIDLPNANTLIVEDADRMGLSQLHQIRGRVGRSARQAYAYFTYRAGKVLSEVAEKRLSAIREFAEFGAGFKIALRDLEIRGAGNLLGPEQHGYIESVGYDLYVRLLNEAVLEENGQTVEPPFEATVEIRTDANIPENYIRTPAQRMEMYKKISLIRTKEDLSDVADEFTDRFGDLPKATERLLSVSLTRALAAQARIRRVCYDLGRLTFFTDEPNLPLWSEIVVENPGLEIRSFPSLSVGVRIKTLDEALARAVSILSRYVELMKEYPAPPKEEKKPPAPPPPPPPSQRRSVMPDKVIRARRKYQKKY